MGRIMMRGRLNFSMALTLLRWQTAMMLPLSCRDRFDPDQIRQLVASTA